MALGLCEWLHFGAAILAFGAQGFVLALVPAGLARDLDPTLRRIAVSTAIVLAVTAAGWLVLQAAELAGAGTAALDPNILSDVLGATAFGHVWIVHFGLISGLVAAIRLGAPASIATLLSALVLASLGLVGHTNLHQGATGMLHRAVGIAHLLCAGAWIGSLLPLLVVMRSAASSERRLDSIATLRRYSAWGHAVVAAVVATGTGNMLLVLDGRPLDGSPLYLAVLAAKLAFVAVMIALALFNRYGLVPRLSTVPSARAWLERLTIGNLVCGALALLLASALGMTDPVPEP